MHVVSLTAREENAFVGIMNACSLSIESFLLLWYILQLLKWAIHLIFILNKT